MDFVIYAVVAIQMFFVMVQIYSIGRKDGQKIERAFWMSTKGVTKEAIDNRMRRGHL